MFYLSRAEQVALFTLVALLLAGAGALTYAKGRQAALPGSAEPIFVPAAAERGEAEVVVEVAGAVARPGVYHLSGGSRVGDAIAWAGGGTRLAELRGLTLAARLQDGEKLVVPAKGTETGPSGMLGAPASAGATVRRPISLNKATQVELETLPGIGPVYAGRIIAYREQKLRREGRGFETTDELLNIPGIGPKRLAAIRDLVTP